MFKAMLIPTDGSELSERAIKQGIGLAKAVGAKVVGLHVTTPFHVIAADPVMVTDTPEQYARDMQILAKKYLAVVEAAAKQAGVPCTSVSRSGEHPYQEIIKAADEEHCDAICMASHGRRGVTALVLGSETTKVLTHSKIPVVVYR